MICPSCGGEYADWAHRCPYCGTVNEHVDEQVYLAHLESLRKRLDAVDEESEASYRKGVSETGRRMMKRVLIIGCILLALAALNFGISLFMQNRQEYEQLHQLEWEREEYPKLDSWYEAGDYDRIVEEYYRLILDERSSHSIFTWPHYNFICDFYIRNQEIQEVMEEMDQGNIPESYPLGTAVYDALFLRYEASEEYLDRLMASYRSNGCYGITADETEKIRQMQVTASIFLADYIGWDESEAESFYLSVSDRGYIRMDSCLERAKELIKEWEP